MQNKQIKPAFGKLETEIMEIVWKLKKASVRDVCDNLQKKKKIAYTTAMTVMSRLHNKGILKRKQDKSSAYIYSPKQKKENFLASLSHKVINNLIKEYGEIAVAQFIDVVESSNSKDLKKWKKKLKKIK